MKHPKCMGYAFGLGYISYKVRTAHGGDELAPIGS